MTVQIGTVLLFAVLVILLSIYQASVVPQQNEQVEFTHNQEVQSQLQDLRDDLLRTATTGSGGSASVALGTQYPVRAVFVNPAPPSGTLRTTPPANLTVENATATGETGDYWTGSARNFSTRGLTYDPLYHVYQNPPTTVYDNGVLYNRFDSGNRTLAGQRLVDGNTVSLVALNGSLSKSSSSTTTVDLRSVSAATRTVTVRNETDENVTLVVPTSLPADEWEDLLSAELNQTKGDDRYVRAVEEVSGRSAVRLVLEPATYELELAKVGVGTDVTDTDAHYVTLVRGDNASVSAGGRQKVVAEVRDRFNNPVSGVTVNLTGAPGSDVAPSTTVETRADGRATFVYEAPADATGTKTLSVNISDSPTPRERATVELNVDGGGGGGGAGGGRTVTYADEYDDWLSDVDANGKEIGVPPLEPYGELQNFENLRDEDGTRATLRKEQTGSRPPEGDMLVGIAIDDVPNASQYVLEVKYQRPGSEVFTVTPVNLSGTDIGPQYQLSGNGQSTATITLSTEATEYLRRTGELYLLVEDTTNDYPRRLRLNYVRVRANA